MFVREIQFISKCLQTTSSALAVQLISDYLVINVLFSVYMTVNLTVSIISHSSPPMYGLYNQQQMCSPVPQRFRAPMNTSMGSPSPFFNSMNRTSGSGTPDSYKSSPSTGSERSTGRGGRLNYMVRHSSSHV